MSESTQKKVKTSTFYISEVGVLVVTFFPPLANLISSINILKLLALFPAKFSSKFVSVLELFVTFPENGMLNAFPKGFYSKEY